MSVNKKPSKTRELPHIPLEILEQIAGHLPDVATARNLSRTCRALRDAGEAGCWATLNLSSAWDPDTMPHPRKLSEDDYTARSNTVSSKIAHTVAAFKAHPYRQDCVKSIRLEPYIGTEDMASLLHIVHEISPQLRRLAITPPPSGDSDSAEGLTRFGALRALRHLVQGVEFPNLEHLQIGLQPGNQNLGFAEWAAIMPKLRSLEVCSVSGCFPHFATEGEAPAIQLPHLESISMDDMWDNRSCSNILAALLAFAPNLTFLRVRGDWYPVPKNKALLAMSKLEKIRTVVLALGEEDPNRGMPSVSLYNFGMSPLSASIVEAVVSDRHAQELSELDLMEELSRITTLERLTILIGPTLSLNEYAALSIDPSPDRTFPIDVDLDFPGRMRRHPAITTILYLYLERPCPSTYQQTFVEPDYFVPPARWEKEGHRGVIIRQYTNPVYEKTENLHHIRILTRTTRAKDNHPYIGARRSWKNLTAFQGETVPLHIMTDVYEALGEDMAFIVGGRDLALPDKAWEILRSWRASVGTPLPELESDMKSSSGESEDEDEMEDEASEQGDWQDEDENSLDDFDGDTEDGVASEESLD